MASYDAAIARSLQQLAALGMGDLSNLLSTGLPKPWGLIGTDTGRGIQAYTGIGGLIGDTNQIVLVIGAQWTPFLNQVSLSGFPYLVQAPVSSSILSGTSGSVTATDTINRILTEARALCDWADNECSPEADLIRGLSVPDFPKSGTANEPSFNRPLQDLYLGMREALWTLIEAAAKLVTAEQTELLICGQGIGAAFAQLAAYDFRPDKPATTVKFKNIRLYTFSTPLNANTTFQSLFEKSITDAWVINAGISPVIDFFPSEPTKDQHGKSLVQLGTVEPQSASLPAFDSPWWERSGPFYTDVLDGKTTQPNASGVSSTTASGYESQLAFTLAQLCAGAAQRVQHPELSPSLPSSWSLVKAFPSDNPWVSVFYRPSPRRYAVVFRTGISFADTMNTLANYAPTTLAWMSKDASAHGGAYGMYTDQIRSDLRAYIESLDWSDTTLVIAGHSLGAMAAMICAVDFNQNPIKGAPAAKAYCFGSPAAAGYSLAGVLPDFRTNVFLIGRVQDAIERVKWNSLLTSYGTAITLGGTTNFDGATFHAINAYIALLDPSQSEAS
jgi:hypothetical protein